MTRRRSLVSLPLSVAVGVLGLSACSSEKPSGLKPYTPSASSSSSPSATKSSKWTPEQQQVIDGYGRFVDLGDAMASKTEKLDKDKLRKVAKEPYATTTFDGIYNTLAQKLVLKGKTRNTISAVTIAGDEATLKTCYDHNHSKLVEPGNPSRKVRNPPPSIATVSLVRAGASWLVAGGNGGEGTCVSG